MKVWITKYALSEGIQEVEGERASTNPKYFARTDGRYGFFGPKDWTPDRAEAVRRAEDMRKRRIAALKKQITKLEKLRFT